MKFNMNHRVRVKLTDAGREYIEGACIPLNEDEDGWSEWQLWDLMGKFGPKYRHCGVSLLFETEIDLCSEKALKLENENIQLRARVKELERTQKDLV